MSQGRTSDAKSSSAPENRERASAQGRALAASGASFGSGSPTNRIAQLQRSVGNQATLQMLARAGAGAQPIQRKPAVLDSWLGAHMRGAKSPQEPTTVDENKKIGKKIKHGQQLDNLEIFDTTSEWVKVKSNGEEGFVRSEKVKEPRDLKTMRGKVKEAQDSGNFGQSEAFEEESGALENTGDTLEITGSGVGGQSDVYSDLSGELKEQIKKDTASGLDTTAKSKEKAGVDKENAKLGVASGLLDFGSGFVGLAKMKKALAESKNKTEKGLTVFEGVQNVEKTFAGTAKLVDNAAKVSGKDDGVGSSEAVSGFGGSIGDALAAVKSAFFMVRDVFKLFKEQFAGDGLTKDELIKGSLSAIQNGLESAQSAVKTVKSILEIFESATGNLKDVIPGIGIAISGIKLTIKVYDMIQWNISKSKMTTIKRDFKDKYTGKDMVKENRYTLFGKTIHKSKGTDKEKLSARRDQLGTKQDRTAEEDEELGDIQTYELAKEMKYINQKRMNRGGMEAGLEMVSMAGDIATLSGAGSAVGISLKAAAGGTKVGMGLFRRAKQYGRDQAAKSGPNSAWSSVFDAEKSSEKKHERRGKDTDLILDMIAKLPEFEDTDAVKKQYLRVEHFIEASGCSPKALYKLNGDIDGQRKLLMDSMKKRD
jgi:hypothetical protein